MNRTTRDTNDQSGTSASEFNFQIRRPIATGEIPFSARWPEPSNPQQLDPSCSIIGKACFGFPRESQNSLQAKCGSLSQTDIGRIVTRTRRNQPIAWCDIQLSGQKDSGGRPAGGRCPSSRELFERNVDRMITGIGNPSRLPGRGSPVKVDDTVLFRTFSSLASSSSR